MTALTLLLVVLAAAGMVALELGLNRRRRRLAQVPPSVDELLAAIDTVDDVVAGIHVHDRADFLRLAQAFPTRASIDFASGALGLAGTPLYVDDTVPAGMIDHLVRRRVTLDRLGPPMTTAAQRVTLHHERLARARRRLDDAETAVTAAETALRAAETALRAAELEADKAAIALAREEDRSR